MWSVTPYDDVPQFKQDVTLFLEQAEVENNLALGVLESLNETEQPVFMAVVEKNGSIAFTIFQNKSGQAILSYPLHDFYPAEIRGIAAEIIRLHPKIPGLIGERTLTSSLGTEIEKLTGKTMNVKMNQRLYKLTALKPISSTTGGGRVVDESDFPVIVQWVAAFAKEVMDPMTEQEANEKARELIGQKRLYGWEDESGLAAMAASARPTKTNCTVNFVYTPPGKRRKGYARSCTAALTERLLKAGYESVSLYTDLKNSTSNKIYMEIGYEPVHDSVLVQFGPS
ncbi:GNAT family N-acetyltransferase [Bacillus marinisedimentorum]|uniref:GNAT family N-acetyltransferase n=1 Tax=Bacillus marinisedimentorum TaxID=1821260 RepID=UPI0007E19EB1|nr:GNAT family N-acetyltransferase [Bacillus marinisedimentorum]